jgi:hypothetical protein
MGFGRDCWNRAFFCAKMEYQANSDFAPASFVEKKFSSVEPLQAVQGSFDCVRLAPLFAQDHREFWNWVSLSR